MEAPAPCGDDGGPCAPSTPEALLALTHRGAEERATTLRAWLCDPIERAHATAALQQAAEVLRRTLPDARLPLDAGPPARASDVTAEAATVDGGPAPATVEGSRDLLCTLPWETLLGGSALLDAVGCDACEGVDESGGDSADDKPLPCGLENEGVDQEPVHRVCALAYAQSGLEFFGTPAEDLIACALDAAEANRPAEAQATVREQEHARLVQRQLRAALPLGPAEWRSLVTAALVADYRPHKLEQKRGPRSLVHGVAALDSQTLRARLRPLLATARSPEGVDAAKLPEAQIQAYALEGPGGTLALICDDAADKSATRRAAFWLQPERVIAVAPPAIEKGFTEEMSGELALQICPRLLDVADLDGDGTPELLLHLPNFYGVGSELQVTSMSSPPQPRARIHETSTEVGPLE